MYQQITAIDSVSRFTRLTVVWLSIIFGAVWLACWVVGIGIPLLLDLYVHPSELARQWSDLIRLLVPIVAALVFVPLNAMFMVLCERRALAMFTVRLGPNRVGPDGFLQTAADAVKLLLKEDITPQGADAFMFTLAPCIFFAPSIIGALPLLAVVTANHNFFSICGIPTGIFYVLAVSSVPVVGLVMGAWASNNKYSLVGGLRSAAQAISYEIPLVLSIITICLLANSLDLVEIVNKQAGGILHWNIFGGGALVNTFIPVFAQVHFYTTWIPAASAVLLGLCCMLLFGIYLTGATAEVNRIPFDLPEAESELVSGYNTEYSGIKFAVFFLAEFTNLFIVCTIATVVFLGGGAGPWEPLDHNILTFLQQMTTLYPALGLFISPTTLLAAFWLILKTYSLVIFAILVRGTLPRFRIDQLLDFGWKRLIPLTLILLLAVMYLKELVQL